MSFVKVSIKPIGPIADLEALASKLEVKYGLRVSYISKTAGIIFGEVPKDKLSALRSEKNLHVRVEKELVRVHPFPSSVRVTPFERAVRISQMSTYVASYRMGITDFWGAYIYGRGIKVAILDTGIRDTHETLKGRVVYKVAIVTDSPEDRFGHGTAVASCVAGWKEDIGFRSPAPRALLYNIKCIGDDGVATIEDCVKGFDLAIELGVDIINFSAGTPDDGDPNNPLRVVAREAVRRGIIVVAAAGNKGPEPQTIDAPACDPAVIAVGGIDATESVWLHSSRGPTKEGITKPDVVSYAQDVWVAGHVADDAYDVKSGTSFATPLVSGFIACLEELTEKRAYTGWLLKDVFPSICEKPIGFPAEKDNEYGWGRPSAKKFISKFAPYLPSRPFFLAMPGFTAQMMLMMPVITMSALSAVMMSRLMSMMMGVI